MSETKFTPGPWKTFMQAGPLVAALPNGPRVYSAGASAYDVLDREADARLIAAAPALHAALKRMTEAFAPYPGVDGESWREEHEAFEQAQAALALVTEETK